MTMNDQETAETAPSAHEPLGVEYPLADWQDDKLRREAEAWQAFKYRVGAGFTYERIAEALGVSVGTAHNRVQQARESLRPHADWARYRQDQLGELAIGKEPLMRALVNPQTPIDEVCKAVAALVKAQERQAFLVGLDLAPTPREELESVDDDELRRIAAETMANDPELAAMVAAMEAD